MRLQIFSYWLHEWQLVAIMTLCVSIISIFFCFLPIGLLVEDWLANKKSPTWRQNSFSRMCSTIDDALSQRYEYFHSSTSHFLRRSWIMRFAWFICHLKTEKKWRNRWVHDDHHMKWGKNRNYSNFNTMGKITKDISIKIKKWDVLFFLNRS